MESPVRQHRPLKHTPVLLQEALQALSVLAEGLYLDATVGAGGHAEEIASRLGAGRLIALDRDPHALALARQALSSFPNVSLHLANFTDLERVLDQERIGALDGALFDLGVSSMQLDQPERGFSFRAAGPLDMRMGLGAARTAADIVNGASEDELEGIIRAYGEERFSKRIAAAIVAHRHRQGALATTQQLADLVEKAVPAAARRHRSIHPATRTFQALRIAVNEELDALPVALEAAFRRLKPGGRLVVIAFHSLEDRLVKGFMKDKARGCTCPPGLPQCVCGKEPQARVYKLVRPLPAEVGQNPRARSARLRTLEKLTPENL